MKFFSALGRPSAELINETLGAVDALDTIETRFDGGQGSVGVREFISAYYGNVADDFECDGDGWELPTPQPKPVLGITREQISSYWHYAANLRVGRPTEFPDIDGTALLSPPSPLPYDCIASDRTIGPYGEWVFGDQILAENPSAVVITDANWTYPGGLCGSAPYANWPGGNPVGPGWKGTVEGIFGYEWEPAVSFASAPANTIAAQHNYAAGPSRWATAGVNADALPIGIPEAVKRWFEGKALVQAKCEVTITGLEYTEGAFTRAAIGDGGDYVTTTTDETEVALILVGRKAAAGNVHWEACAGGISAVVKSDKTAVLDVTDIVAVMLDKTNDFDTYALLPGFAGGFLDPGGQGGALRAMIPAGDLSYDSGTDTWFVSSGSLRQLSFGSIGLGKLVIKADYSGVPISRCQDWERWPQTTV